MYKITRILREPEFESKHGIHRVTVALSPGAGKCSICRIIYAGLSMGQRGHLALGGLIRLCE